MQFQLKLKVVEKLCMFLEVQWLHNYWFQCYNHKHTSVTVRHVHQQCSRSQLASHDVSLAAMGVNICLPHFNYGK